MTEIEESGILEGFLCPICKTDLETIAQLHAHFHEQHEDLDVLKFLKGVVGQAKKILKSNKEDDIQNKKEVGYNLDQYIDHFQETGVTRSYIEEFKEFRTVRLEGYSDETNKIIIRLDRLLTNIPTDLAKKKMHEQTEVPWIDGQDVSRCPNCAKLFHLTRRQHHCRLCGSIICHDCSRFLPISTAKQVLSKPSEDGVSSEVKHADSTDMSLRSCDYCIMLLENREQMKANRNSKSVISQLYENLREQMIAVDKHSELYHKMSISLNSGESKYNLKDAQELWQKIIKLAETVDKYGAKIATLNTNDPNNSVSDKQLRLQAAIKSGTAEYIRSKVLNLPPVPSPEKYIQLQNNRRKKIEEQIKEEKLESGLNNVPLKKEYLEFKPILIKSQFAENEGWIPDNISVRRNDDPLIEQMTNIQHYIKQAREALRFEEVASLERHFSELQEEYMKKYQKNNS